VLPAASARSDATSETLHAIVEAGRLDGLRWPRFPDFRPLLEELYAPGGYAPLWLADGRPTDQARAALAVLHEADAKGLDARDYDVDRLDSEAKALAETHGPPQVLARFDATLSVAFVRTVSALHVGRVHPKRLRFGYDIDPKRYDLAVRIREAMAQGRLRELVANAEPHFAQDRMLEEQLARYRALARDPSQGPVHVTVRKLVPGDPLAGAPGLARWLTALGDLPAGAPVSERYAGAVVEAVRHFQARHGLDPDGVIGPATSRALAVPADARVRQIELALERLRWIPAIALGRVVLVNIPGFQLRAFDDLSGSAGPTLRMAVVVGKAARTETPIFTGAMVTVVFAPYWNVPRSIVRKEILPKLRRDPAYLVEQDMEIVRDGRVLALSAEAIVSLAAGDARLRQRPGPSNALGRVKFLFPNTKDVYLHDTPARALFEKVRRDFSHGCIRVADAPALARWVLAPQGWDAERVDAALARTTRLAVPLRKPVPVVIYYTTAVAHHDGTISFYDDLYGHDAALEQALAAGYPYPDPQ
jgi:murein L,D-transpeptidase YcbB/YkuD